MRVKVTVSNGSMVANKVEVVWGYESAFVQKLYRWFYMRIGLEQCVFSVASGNVARKERVQYRR